MPERKRIGTYLWAERLQTGAGEYRIVNTKGDILGGIEWFPQWKKLVFYSVECAGFDAMCLREISDFLLKMREEQAHEA
jgi:hypothetical protein